MMLKIGATYRTRAGYDVLLTHVTVIPFMVGSERREWRGVSGVYMDDGTRSTWEADGRFSPVQEGAEDLTCRVA